MSPVAMTTCKECLKAVAADAPTCPHCGTTAPGEGAAERDAAAKERDAASDVAFKKGVRKWGLVAVGLVLLFLLPVGISAIRDAASKIDLDEAAKNACSSVTTAEYGGTPVRQGLGRVQAVAYGLESNSEGLKAAAGGDRSGPVDPETVNQKYRAVAAWCAANAD